MFGILFIDDKGGESQARYIFKNFEDVKTYLEDNGFTRIEDKIFSFYKEYEDNSMLKAIAIRKEWWTKK